MKSLLLATCAVWLLGAFSASAHAQNVTFAGVQTTVVQNTVLGFELCPYSVAVDRAGDVFIADYCNDRVVEVPAGGGAQSTVGSGLSSPHGVAVDGAGNVFIADSGNNRVVKVPAGGGAQTTVPASGLSGPFGVALDGAGDVLIADSGKNRVVKVPAGGGAQTTVGSGLNGPQGVAVDSAGNVFIADTYNTQVVKVPAGGGPQTTVGSGLSYPTGVTVDGAGNVFIADNLNNQVVEVPAGGGAQITVASNLTQPGGVAVDGAGDVFIADTFDNRVLEQQDVAVNFGNLNVCPGAQTTPAPCNQTLTLNYNVAVTTTFGTTNVVTQGAPNLDFKLSSGGTCTGTVAAGLTCTESVTFAPLAPGARMGAVRLTNNSGKLLATTMVHGIGQGPAIAFGPGIQTTVPTSGLSFPFGVAVDEAGNVFIADNNSNRVVEIPAGGGAQITVPASGLLYPRSVAVDGAGDVFIADQGNSRVVEVPAGGGAQTTVGSGLNQPYSVAVDGAGDVFIADTVNNRVVEVPAGGGPQTTVGSGLSSPFGVAVDGVGDVFIADTSHSRVVKVPAGGGAQTTVGTGLNSPYGVAVDGAGDLFIADIGLDQLVEVPAGGGAQTTVPASGLNQPTGVAVDGAGDVFIANHNNDQVVEVRRSQLPTLTFASTLLGSTSSDSPQSVTIQNIGNQPLNAVTPGLVVGGPNFFQAAGSGTPADCTSSFSLTPGATCDLSISFKPTTIGSLSSTATFTDNALNTSPSASQNIALQGIGQGTQTIAFTTNAPASAIYNTGFTVAATGGASGNQVIFTSSGACSNVGSTYTMTSGTGTCSVIANQAGSTYYLAASTVTQTVTANLASQTITFTQSAPANAPYNGSFTVAATASSGQPVLFSSSGVCTNLGATFTMTNSTGKCTVTASQSGNANYLAAPVVTETTTATKAAQTVTFTGPPATAPYQSTFPVSTTTNSGVTPTITATGACSISVTTVTMTSGTGPCTMTAKWATNTYYLAATVTKTTTAQKLVSTVNWTTPAAISYGTLLSGTQLNATANVAGSLVYSPAAGTVPKAGNDTLKVTFTPTLSKDYTTVTDSVVLHVNQATSSVTWPAPAAIAYGTPLTGTQLNATANVAGTFVYSPAAGAVLTAGTHTLSVTFTPTDHTDYTKASAAVTLVVNKVGTTTTITSNLPNPSATGQAVTVHFTVTQATDYAAPTGSVTVKASTLEHCAGALASGSGSCAVTFNTAGPRTLTATYAGNSNNASSISAAVAQTVN